ASDSRRGVDCHLMPRHKLREHAAPDQGADRRSHPMFKVFLAGSALCAATLGTAIASADELTVLREADLAATASAADPVVAYVLPTPPNERVVAYVLPTPPNV